MNALQKVVARLFRFKAASGMSYSLKDPDFVSRFGAPTYSGKSVTEQSAMQVSTAWACVRILAETIGSLPMAIYERDAKGNAQKVDHDLTSLLVTSPNADMTSVEYREALITNLALRGNTYSYKETNGAGGVSSLYPMPSGDVTPKRANDGTVYYEWRDRGKTEKLPQEKVWHIKGFGSDGLIGLSPIAYARQALGVALAAEEFQARFFANGASPSYIIEIPQWLEKDQRDIARENINKLWSGLDNMHRAQLLEGGMKATAATMPLEDAQFMELRGFSIQEICRIYRIPPHMVMDLSRSTNNNIEHQGQEFVMFTLAPYLTRIEASVSRWLMSPEDRRRYFLRFNVDALLRADAAGRAALYTSALQNGWMSRNEVRALENRNTSDDPGMDSYTAQSNLSSVGNIVSTPVAAPAPQPPTTASTDGVLKYVLSRFEEKAVQPAPVVQQPSDVKHSVEVPGLREIASRFAAIVENREEDNRKHLPAALKKVSEDIAVLVSTNGGEQARAMKSLVEGFAALIDAGQQANKNALESLAYNFQESLKSLREDQRAELDKVSQGLSMLLAVAQSDRVLEYDDAGNPVRSRVSLQ